VGRAIRFLRGRKNIMAEGGPSAGASELPRKRVAVTVGLGSGLGCLGLS
jgi:hypothetical protein